MKKLLITFSALSLLAGCSNNINLSPDLSQQVMVQSNSPVGTELTDPQLSRLFPKIVKGNRWVYSAMHATGSQDGTGIGMSWKFSIEITDVIGQNVKALIKSEPLDDPLPPRKKSMRNQVITATAGKFWKTLSLALFSEHSKPLEKVKFNQFCGTIPGVDEDCLSDIKVEAGTFKGNTVISSFKSQEEFYDDITAPPIIVDTVADTELKVAPNVGILQMKGNTRFEYDNIENYVDTDFELAEYRISR
jgi:hypothetical protein